MRHPLILTLCCLLFPLSTIGLPAPLPAGNFHLAGAVTKAADYSPQKLRVQFKSSLQAITYTRKGVKHTAQAVPLWTVLSAAQPRTNPQIKNHTLQFIVLVTGGDGYTAAFSFGELAPEFGNHAAWLTLDEDSKPLGEGTAQDINLVVPDDVKAGRWVHSARQITVVDEAQAAATGRP